MLILYMYVYIYISVTALIFFLGYYSAFWCDKVPECIVNCTILYYMIRYYDAL